MAKDQFGGVDVDEFGGIAVEDEAPAPYEGPSGLGAVTFGGAARPAEVKADDTPEKAELRASLAEQTRQARMEGRAIDAGESAIGLLERGAYTARQMDPITATRRALHAFDPNPQPPISVENAQAALRFINPFGTPAEGSAGQGLEQFGAEFISGMSEPEAAAALMAGKVDPKLAARLFQPGLIEGSGEAVNRLLQSQTPAETVKAGLETTMTVGGALGIERALAQKPGPPIPPNTGAVLPPMRGAPVQRIEPPVIERAADPAALATQMQREATTSYPSVVVRPPRPTVPEGPLTPPPDVAAAAPVEMGRGWTDFVAELQSRGTGKETIADIQKMFPQMQMNREGARRLGRDAFGDDWQGGGDGGGAAPAPKPVAPPTVAPAPAAPAAAGPPFLGADKSTWTPEYLADRLGQPGNLRAIVNSINNAPELKRKFPLKEDARPETILKAIHDLLDARAKATPPRPPPPPQEGGAPVPVPEPPTKPTAPAEGAKANPHDFVPAIQDVAGNDIPGKKGQVHNDILDTKKEDMDWRLDNFEHTLPEGKGRGFYYKGKFISREEAASLLGEKEPLQSERLKVLQENTPEAPTAPTPQAAPAPAETPAAAGDKVEKALGPQRVVTEAVPLSNKGAKQARTILIRELEKLRDELTPEEKRKQVTIEIPGDGEFTVFKTKENLEYLIKRSRGIKTTPPKGFKEKMPVAGIPPDVWVNSSEPTHMVEFLMGGGKVDRMKGRPITLESKNAKGQQFYLTSNGEQFRVTEARTGTGVGEWADTVSKALENAEKRSDELPNQTKSINDYIKKHGERAKPEPITPESKPTPAAPDPVAEGKPTPTAEGAKGIGGQAFKDLRDKLDRNEGGGRDFTNSLVDAGTYFLKKGMKFADWSARMVKEFGENVRNWLETIWDHVRLKDLSRIEAMSDADWNAWYSRLKIGPDTISALGSRFGVKDLPDLLEAHQRGMSSVKTMSEQAMEKFNAGDMAGGNQLMTAAQQSAKRAQTFHELARHIPEVAEAIKGFEKTEEVRAKMQDMAGIEREKRGPQATPITLEREAGAGIPIPRNVTETLKKTRDTLKTLWKTRDVRDVMAWTKDATQAAQIYGQRVGNNVRGQLRRTMGRGTKPNVLDENALTFVREADGDRSQLAVMRGKLTASTAADPKWKAAALKAIDHAEINWDRINPIAQKYGRATDAQVAAENAAGINTLSRKGYVMHAQDVQNEFGFFSGTAGEGTTGFKHARTHETFADSIAAGIDPKTLNGVVLLSQRVARGQMLINNRMWVESLRTTVDPQTRKPVVTEPEVISRGPGLPPDIRSPADYVTEIAGGRPIAVLKSYAGIFRALTEPSKFSESLGWNMALKAATTGKHIALMLDTFHLGRIAFWESIIKPLSFTDPKLPLPSYKRGVLTLDYSPAELQRMANAGEINPAHLPEILQAQRDVDMLVKNGYNVAKISDQLHQEWLQQIPITGTFNKWLFNQFQRGAMAEIGAMEVPRYRRMHPSWTDRQVYREVAKDLNTRFGNLGRQGILKSKTAQDMARLTFLAPQWNEGLIRSEVGAITGTVKGIASTAKEGRLSFGILPRAVGAMLLGQFAANQIINYITRGKPTWENEEEGVGAKLSAWIPDLAGKGPGFFLHPAGLAAEITHLLTSKYEKKDDFREALMSFMGGRWSTLARPAVTFLTRRDIFQRLIRPENIWKETAKAAVPVPIGAGAAVPAIAGAITGESKEPYPGAYQRQMMSSAGVKTDAAESPGQRIVALAQNWKKSQGIKAPGEFYESAYALLRNAIRRGSLKEGRQEYEELLKTKTPKQIDEAMKPWTGGTVDKNLNYNEAHPKPLTGSAKHESEFLSTLTPAQREIYTKAKEEHALQYKTFQNMLRSTKGKPVTDEFGGVPVE